LTARERARCVAPVCCVWHAGVQHVKIVHEACCSSWCDVAQSICKPSGKALDQMWCWSDPGRLAQNLQSKAWMPLILPRTLWPRGLRRWLKVPFRKGVGSEPTGVTLFGLILRPDVLHTWSGPYIQRAPATLGPCRCFRNCRLAQTTPAYKCQLQQGGNQVVRCQGQHRLHQLA
jgi:hypothetical protein